MTEPANADKKKAKLLTVKAIDAAKPNPDKDYKLTATNEHGMYVLVKKNGSKWFQWRYTFDGKDKLLSLGVYPETGLELAREKRDRERALLASGVDPSAQRKAQKAAKEEINANSFEVITREWFERNKPTLSEGHAEKTIRRFERDIFPSIGKRPIAEIKAPELLAVIRKIEDRGALETAHRALSSCGQVFRYAIATGRAERDTAADLRGALPPTQGSHFAAVTEPLRVGELLRMFDGYQGTLTVFCALKLAPLVFVRPGELRAMPWHEVDFDAAEWRYTVSKTDTQHIVPLSTQAIAILREMQAVTGRGHYVFPSARSQDRPMSDNAILAAMRRLGIGKDEMSGHGFRAMARTIMDEVLGFRVDYIEQQLAHAVRDPNGRAYNRTAYLPERKKMMQAWADYLDTLKRGADVIPINRKTA